MNSKADLVVVGAGIAGLAAANRAAALGCRVVVLEQGADERYLCNSRVATGVLNVAHTDPHSDPAVLRHAIALDTEGYAAPALADALAAQAARSMGWLRAEGARIIEVPIQGKTRWMLAPPRTLSAGLDWEGRGADVILQTLGRNLKARGGTIMLGTRARSLRMDARRCTGIVAEQAGRALQLEAANVLLADGGFQGNPDLLRRFISPRPQSLTQRNAGSSQGDALLMAEAAGARLTDATSFYGHLLSRDSMSNTGLWPYPTMDTLAGAAIMVDRNGRRFIDEGLGGIAHSNALARSADPLAATAIFDQAIWETTGRAELVPPNPALVDAGGTLISAPDLAALAGRIGVAPETVLETVAAYNRAVIAEQGERLDPPRTSGRMFGESRNAGKRVSVAPVATPPFHAIPLAAGISYTMGGIEIDARARVVGHDGAPIAGLYAAGSCTGGVEGGPLGGYIGGYLKALGLALLAAADIGATVETGTA
ncbi:MAG: fumarate reductase flavoprotein subunit [Alphaproteobacteria bacterium]|nr:fumarate reductase flavoprotein subunit [Alphaproteobacteria bacterium]